MRVCDTCSSQGRPDHFDLAVSCGPSLASDAKQSSAAILEVERLSTSAAHGRARHQQRIKRPRPPLIERTREALEPGCVRAGWFDDLVWTASLARNREGGLRACAEAAQRNSPRGKPREHDVVDDARTRPGRRRALCGVVVPRADALGRAAPLAQLATASHFTVNSVFSQHFIVVLEKR